MSIKRHIKNTAIAMTIIIGTASTVFAATTYKDVPTSHWGYSSITKVAEMGIMVGDGDNYYPDKVIDKLEASRILARIAGYNAAAGFTPLSPTTSTINMYKKAFPQKWGTMNKDYENSVAYLYQKEVLAISDLDKFVVKTDTGAEKLNNLSREDMAVFLVKTMGKKNEAIAYKGNYKFTDDSSISEVAKPYVYYLKSLGVISVDATNKFNPTGSITKAQMAVFLDRAIYSKDSVKAPTANTPPPVSNTNSITNQTQAPTATQINVTSDEGKIVNIYASSNVLGILNSSNQTKVYRLASNVKIYLDGFSSTIDKLTQNMPVVVVIMNGEVTELRAQKVSVPVNGQVTPPTTNQPTTTIPSTNPTTKPTTNPTTTTTPVVTPVIDNSQLITRVCTVASTGTINNSKTITVIVQMLNPSGDIYKEEQTFILANNCSVKRGDRDVALSTIEKDDIVTLKINGNNVYSIFVEEKNMTLTGAELIDKRLNDENVPVLTIKSKDGTKYELKVTNSSDLKRKGDGAVKWKQLRIGDTVDVDKEYNTITYLYATGKTSTVEGWVEEIVISDYSSITLKDSYGEHTKYSVSTPRDLYSITLGSKIKLTLDSKEVSSIRVLSASVTANSVQGTVESMRYSNDYLYVTTDSADSVKVTFDKNTRVYDSILDKTVTVDDIDVNMYISVVFTNSYDKIAKTITIVTK